VLYSRGVSSTDLVSVLEGFNKAAGY